MVLDIVEDILDCENSFGIIDTKGLTFFVLKVLDAMEKEKYSYKKIATKSLILDEIKNFNKVHKSEAGAEEYELCYFALKILRKFNVDIGYENEPWVRDFLLSYPFKG
jgi:hypothetical protein